MPKMAEADLKSLLIAEKSDALSAAAASKLSEERERAMNYYNGDVSADMPTVTDRSKAVSYDVSDTVEGLMPVLCEMFFGGDTVVKFSPVSEEDEDQAEQETAYVNHVWKEQNPGFLTGYSWLKDALLQKNGVVKVSWRESEDEERETYLDQPDDVYALFLADEEVEIVEHTEHAPEGPPPAPVAPPPDPNQMQPGMMPAGQMPPDAGAAPPAMGASGPADMMPPAEPDTDEAVPYGPTHDFTVVSKRKYGCCKVEAVPPEEFGVGRTAKLGQRLDYCYHEVRHTEAGWIDQGFDAEQIKKLPTAPFDTSAESLARDTVNERSEGNKSDLNKPNRLIVGTEHYCVLDYEGDGKARLYRVTTGGDASSTEILKRNGKLDIEQVPFDPFATITPFIVTHRWFGRSAADLVIDIQRIKTSMLRGIADNVYLANNQRLEVAESFAHPKTLDDILDNRIGGVVRTKQPGGINPIVNQPIGDFVFPVIEYFDQVREWRTGVTRHGQGLDSEALQDIGDDARARLQDAAMEKTKLIARIFAETGFKDLFWKIHATVRKHESSKPTVKLMGKWVTVDPREWKRRDDLVANVGLGGGSKSQQIAFWGNEISTQQESLAAVPGLTTPGKIYNALKKRLELAGHKDVDQYWSNPDEQPPPEPQPDPKMAEVQGKLQIAQQKAETDAQAQQAKQQGDLAVSAKKLETDKAKMVLQMELQRQKLQAEHDLKMQQMDGEFQMKAWQLEQEAQLERESMIIGAHVKIKTAPVKMGGKPG